MGLKAILKASPTVLHQWESMDSGQGKQPGASHTPGGLHLLSLFHPGPFMFGMTYRPMLPYASGTGLHML